jgi:hypothetical protein
MGVRTRARQSHAKSCVIAHENCAGWPLLLLTGILLHALRNA